MIPPAKEQLLNSPNSYIQNEIMINTFGTDIYLLQSGWKSVIMYSLSLSVPRSSESTPLPKSSFQTEELMNWRTSSNFVGRFPGFTFGYKYSNTLYPISNPDWSILKENRNNISLTSALILYCYLLFVFHNLRILQIERRRYSRLPIIDKELSF